MGPWAMGQAENAFLNGFLCVARAFDVRHMPKIHSSGGPGSSLRARD